MTTINIEERLRCRMAEAALQRRREREFAFSEAYCLLSQQRKEMEQAVLSAASSIIDAWDDWDAEASQAAQQDQDDRSYRHVMMTHIVTRLWREFGWKEHE